MEEDCCFTLKRHGLIYSLLVGVFIIVNVGYAKDKQTADMTPDVITFGILPLLSTKKLVNRFLPLTDYLATALQISVVLETAPGFAEFVHRTQHEQRYDVLFTAPHLVYMAHDKAGYSVVVRPDTPEVQAVIVVPPDSSINTINDLQGARLATADPMALATVLVTSLLKTSGIDPEKDLVLVSTPSNNASLLLLKKHVTDAASLMLPTFEYLQQRYSLNMTILAKTKSTLHMPIAIAAWIGKSRLQQIKHILLNMHNTPAGQKILTQLAWPKFVPASDKEYQPFAWLISSIND